MLFLSDFFAVVRVEMIGFTLNVWFCIIKCYFWFVANVLFRNGGYYRENCLFCAQ